MFLGVGSPINLDNILVSDKKEIIENIINNIGCFCGEYY